MDLLDKLMKDLEWRVGEIATLKSLLSRPKITDTQSKVLLRAGWALLYAHYEGFVKNSLISFYDSVQGCGLKASSLPLRTKAFALESDIKKIRNTEAVQFVDVITAFVHCDLNSPARFSEIDTRSNLYFSVLTELLSTADVKQINTSTAHWKINNLVEKRNKIAHGEKAFIGDRDYFLEQCDFIERVMYELTENIEERFKQPPYD